MTTLQVCGVKLIIKSHMCPEFSSFGIAKLVLIVTWTFDLWTLDFNSNPGPKVQVTIRSFAIQKLENSGHIVMSLYQMAEPLSNGKEKTLKNVKKI